ncbi:MAG: class I SAM-dependent rRNA methyltransferase [Gammaproteobacteria bacterium]|nr:class I SAM-dependent rRNA methyltransferase [Gammaproteobacteria bacterium]
MSFPELYLLKNEDRRIRAGHPWIYSNEIDNKKSPLKSFQPGEAVHIKAHDHSILGTAYVNPHSLITARLFSRKSNATLDTTLLTRRLRIALRRREQFFPLPYYRMVFAEGDGLPGLIIDRMNEHLVCQLNTAGMDAVKTQLIDALIEILPETKSIIFRNDSSARKLENLNEEIITGFGTPPEKVLLTENDCHFYVPLWEGQKTGWFYDHRINRASLKDHVINKRVLDLFSYLGGWGIQAANYGAEEVICMDISKLSEQMIHENAKLNGVEDKIKTYTEDAFVALKQLHQAKETFDVIILDPPAFVKKQKDRKEGLIAYQRLNEMAMKILRPGGLLFSCSCSMHVSFDDLLQTIRRASVNINKIDTMQMIARGAQGPDHPVHLMIPEMDYLKMIVVHGV